MMTRVIIDTGPLLAFLSERDDAHEWTCDRMNTFAYPLLTCEAVLSESGNTLMCRCLLPTPALFAWRNCMTTARF